MKDKNKIIIAIVATLFIAGGAGFFGGMKYQQSKMTTTRFGNFQTGGRNGNMMARTGSGMGGNFRPVSGDIISADDKSITVKMSDGSSKIILFSSSMTINKSAEATKSDLAVGQKVAVFGMQNSDGSLTAESIQLNPIMRVPGSPSPQK